ncbi:unnamed protein product [Brassicogethes aeneus]|uniref:Uncharacterized protein n=1 Tax=Brassicogethes aeneus TaxID=1431903 RepID=A0A9P0ANX1_BRAAE|nr:unnamed protein product [Brassicogethes aeneus]
MLETVTWNFSVSGHGKGPMDGVGGTLKRKADRLVFQGRDITSAKEFVEAVNKSSIKVWEVPGEKILKIKELELPKNIPSVPNIMSLHQVTWSKMQETKLFLRTLSCFVCDKCTLCSKIFRSYYSA